MWLSYWGLTRDPFSERDSPYVALPGHEEAAARLVDLIETGRRWGILSGPSGVGKTRVLRRVLSQVRSPMRRIALTTAPVDGIALDLDLACALSARPPAGSARAEARRALEQVVRRCAVQNQQVVLAIDGTDHLAEGPERTGMSRLGLLGEACGARVTVLRVHSEAFSEDDGSNREAYCTVRLAPLMLSEARQYLEARLAAAGCREALFSPRALGRLHLLTGGLPRGLDGLASRCLMVAASRNLEAVPSDLVDAIAAGALPTLPGLVRTRGVGRSG